MVSGSLGIDFRDSLGWFWKHRTTIYVDGIECSCLPPVMGFIPVLDYSKKDWLSLFFASPDYFHRAHQIVLANMFDDRIIVNIPQRRIEQLNDFIDLYEITLWDDMSFFPQELKGRVISAKVDFDLDEELKIKKGFAPTPEVVYTFLSNPYLLFREASGTCEYKECVIRRFAWTFPEELRRITYIAEGSIRGVGGIRGFTSYHHICLMQFLADRLIAVNSKTPCCVRDIPHARRKCPVCHYEVICCGVRFGAVRDEKGPALLHPWCNIWKEQMGIFTCELCYGFSSSIISTADGKWVCHNCYFVLRMT